MSSRPRILWLHTQPEHYFNCMIDDLARVGTCEYIAAFSRKAKSWSVEAPLPEVAETVVLRRVSKAGERDPTYLRRFHADWRAELHPLKFDAAFVAGYAWRTNRELIRDCRRRGIPVAMFTDSNLRSQRGDSFKLRAKRWLKRKMLKSLIADLDYILVANRLGVAYWRYYGAPSSKIILCPYYADYHRVELARKTERAEITGRVPGMKEAVDPHYLFTAARLVPAKGLDLLIDAFRNARLAERNYHCVIAGIGPLEKELKERAGDLLGKHIHFVGFQQPTDNLALMAHADLFVLPSIYEPHGIVVQESLAAGTPVLASDVCGAAYDLVIPGISGDQFKSGDAKSMQGKLEKLLSDSPRLSAMRSAARTTFEKWFAKTSPVVIVDQLAQRMVRKTPEAKKSVTKKRAIFFLKLIILLAVLATVARTVWKAWDNASKNANDAHIPLNLHSIDWRFGLLAILGFAGSMLVSAIIWRWLGKKMGDRSPAVPLIGAYTFSQMGKYVPGKVALLLMRIERSGRYGMTLSICTVSTLLENALYMISGLIGMVAIAHIAAGIATDNKIREYLWPITIAVVLIIASACHPRIFYGVVNPIMKRMKLQPVTREQQLTIGTLFIAVIGFVPCWLFGGFALWASTCCLHPIPLDGSIWFAGAFSLSVIIGMISLLPGGAGVREVVLGAAVAMQLSPVVGHSEAVLLGTVVAVLQRLFQLAAEVLLGITGSVITRKSKDHSAPPAPST